MSWSDQKEPERGAAIQSELQTDQISSGDRAAGIARSKSRREAFLINGSQLQVVKPLPGAPAMAGDMCGPYAEAVLERMQAFSEDAVSRVMAGRYRKKLSLPDPPCRQKMVALSSTVKGLAGAGMAGEELFLIPEERLSADMPLGLLLEEMAVALKISSSGLLLLRGGKAVSHGKTWKALREVLPDTMLRVDLNCGALFPLVCRKNQQRYIEASLGEGTVRLDDEGFGQLPGTVQVIHEYRRFVTDEAPDDGTHCLLNYGRSGVLAHAVGSARDGGRDLFIPIGYFPMAPSWPLPLGAKQWGRNLDVWSCQQSLPEIKGLLDAHAADTDDRPLPRYQMIVDPNQFVRETAAGPVWVPCEFDVAADGSARLVGGSERVSTHREAVKHPEAPAATAPPAWRSAWRSLSCRHRIGCQQLGLGCP